MVTLFVTRPLTAEVLVDGALEATIWLLLATIGLVLTLRRPRNPIGWLYAAAAALVWTAYVPWDPWVDQLPRIGRPLPLAAHLAALAGDCWWAVGLTLAIILPLLLLPKGRRRSRRYDAARTVEGFAARLREQVDLDALAAELLAVVDQTVQPTTASLWLRPPPGPRPPR